ncbi:MAG: hypothetical protein V2A54_17975 [Bacteroidota bacterium]
MIKRISILIIFIELVSLLDAFGQSQAKKNDFNIDTNQIYVNRNRDKTFFEEPKDTVLIQFIRFSNGRRVFVSQQYSNFIDAYRLNNFEDGFKGYYKTNKRGKIKIHVTKKFGFANIKVIYLKGNITYNILTLTKKIEGFSAYRFGGINFWRKLPQSLTYKKEEFNKKLFFTWKKK